MKRIALGGTTILGAIVALACSGTTAFSVTPYSTGKDNVAPPQTYQLFIGDKELSLAEGETITAEGTFENPQIRVVAVPTRKFTYNGMAFEYAQEFTFEADLADADYQDWTLSGNNVKLMLFWMAEGATTKEFTDELISQFGAENCTTEPTSATFGELTLRGLRLNANVLGSRFHMDTFAIPSKRGTRLFVIQDSLPDGQEQSEEARVAYQRLKETFRLAEE